MYGRNTLKNVNTLLIMAARNFLGQEVVISLCYSISLKYTSNLEATVCMAQLNTGTTGGYQAFRITVAAAFEQYIV